MPVTCHHVGCTKQANFGVAGSNKPEFCSQHKMDGMVNVKNKRCAHHGCTKRANYGVAGSNRSEFCSQHKMDGMVDVKSKTCAHLGCTKQAAYGVAGSSKPEFCSEHKMDGMVDVKHKRHTNESVSYSTSAFEGFGNISASESRSSADSIISGGGKKRGRGGSANSAKTADLAAAGEKRQKRCSRPADAETSSGRSTGGIQRPRRAPADDAPFAPAPARPEELEGGARAGRESLPGTDSPAVVKMETGLFEGRPSGSFQSRRARGRRE